MNIRKLDDSLSISPQITPGDVETIAARGFRSIICNRPDGEAAGQPDFEQISSAADASGLEFRYIPVTSGQLTDQNVADFNAALCEMPAPVLAYCRSGTRSAMLWSLSKKAA